MEAAVAGLGLVQGLDVMVRSAVAEGRLVEVLPAFAPEGPPVHVVFLRERQSIPAVRVVLDWIVGVLG